VIDFGTYFISEWPFLAPEQPSLLLRPPTGFGTFRPSRSEPWKRSRRSALGSDSGRWKPRVPRAGSHPTELIPTGVANGRYGGMKSGSRRQGTPFASHQAAVGSRPNTLIYYLRQTVASSLAAHAFLSEGGAFWHGKPWIWKAFLSRFSRTSQRGAQCPVPCSCSTDWTGTLRPTAITQFRSGNGFACWCLRRSLTRRVSRPGDRRAL
jgi:hypothetical protein